ncbi:MAG: MBL fold metallo-hydrolase [Actinomycetota bacterium]
MSRVCVNGYEVLALTDFEGPFMGIDRLFPGIPERQWGRYVSRYPWAFADGRTVMGRVGVYLLRSEGRTVLVDTGVGTGPAMRGRLPAELKDAGVRPEDVDLVFFTHLHGDHVGWSLTGNGRPAFPNARYVVQGEEWESVEPYMRRVLSPLEHAGVLEFLDGEEFLAADLVAIPTPGHSPGHQSLFIYGAEGLLVAGDVIVNPAQVTETTWNTVFDADRVRAAHTRLQLMDWLEKDGILIAAGHVPDGGFGRLLREDGRRYWLPVGDGRPGVEAPPQGTLSAG